MKNSLWHVIFVCPSPCPVCMFILFNHQIDLNQVRGMVLEDLGTPQIYCIPNHSFPAGLQAHWFCFLRLTGSIPASAFSFFDVSTYPVGAGLFFWIHPSLLRLNIFFFQQRVFISEINEDYNKVNKFFIHYFAINVWIPFSFYVPPRSPIRTSRCCFRVERPA